LRREALSHTVAARVKIGLVILHADPAKGGAEGYTVNLAGSLKRRGHNVFLLAASFAESAQIVGNIWLEHTGLTRTARYRSFVNSLETHLDAGARYDVLHAIAPVWRCDLYHPQAGLSAEAIATGHLRYTGIRRPLDRLATRLNPKRQFVAAVERDLLTHSGSETKVLCVSELVKETARRHYQLPQDRLVTLFNAIDPARFDPIAKPGAGNAVRQELKLGAEKVVALIVAQDFHRKGVRPAIEAIAKVDDPRLVLVVVGKPDPREFRALAVTMGLADRVLFAGPTVDTYPFYQAADFFVLPTWHDPCSLVVLEALAMGLPTITTAQNGAHEVIIEGVHGYTLSSPADVDGLAARMRELIPAQRRAPMREACLALRPRLSWQAHLDQLEALYREVRR
jgi:UDP-glucose:(heptosyl)LPS alpha-1,3-glucosyltransferase